MIDWYENRDHLKPDMVFEARDDSLVMLDRRVPGDGSKWYVADWDGRHWTWCDGTIEPGDLITHRPDMENGL